MRVIITIAFFFCFLFFSNAQAQQAPGHILSGQVLDRTSSIPVGNASVMIEYNQNGRRIAAGMTDSSGNFSIVYRYDGPVKLVVSAAGYTGYTNDSIGSGESQLNIRAATIYLRASISSLRTVEVVATTPVIVDKADKIVYNVANDITTQGGDVIDVLRKVPQVNVDADGNVELQGNANIRFLINGKPSSIFGNSLADALASIPTSEVKSIEVMTTPGAKYDAQGTGGVINIILRDNKVHGINGNLNLAAGSRIENGSFNLNMRQGNLGLNAFFSGHGMIKAKTLFDQNRTSTDTQTTMQLDQNGYSDFNRTGYQTGLSADWDVTKRDNLTASFTYHHFENNNTGMANQDQQTLDGSGQPVADLQSISNSDSRLQVGSFDWSVGYTRKFKTDGQQLDFLYSASDGTPYNSYTQSQRYLDASLPFSGTSSTNPGKDKQTILSLDYSQPVSKNFKLDMGAKTTFQHISNTANIDTYMPSLNAYRPDSSQSYALNYTMKIYAAYLSGTFSLFDYLDVIAGLRYEYTRLGIDYQHTHIPSYNTVVPSVILSHKFGDDQTLKLAFTRRIERPEYRELNPFLNFSDPYNITTGNPMLKPEIGTNFELGYARNFKNGGNIYIGAMERINSQDIKNYTLFYPSYTIGDSVYQNVSVTTRKNTGHEYNTGLILTSSLPLGAFNLRENVMIFNRHIIADLDSIPVINSLNWRANLNASYTFGHDLVLEAFADYRSSFKSIQGKQPGEFMYTLALRKVFDNKKMSIGLTTTNPFNKYMNRVTTIQTGNYISYYRSRLPFRSFGVSFTYKFGKLDTKNNKDDNPLDNVMGDG